MSEPIPEWPDPDAPEYFAGWDYQHQRAEAYAARLKVAVEALRDIADDPFADGWRRRVCYAQTALARIGPLPEPPKDGG